MIRLSLFTIAIASFGVLSGLGQSPRVAGRHYELRGSQGICPRISVSIHGNQESDEEPLTFTVNVEGGNPNVVPVYAWTISDGNVIEGQRSPSIRVDRTGLGGRSLTATVDVSGFDSNCSATASATSLIIDRPPNPTKSESYGVLPRNEERKRLNAFATQLENQPAAQGYILAYNGRHGRANKAQTKAKQSRDYLVLKRKIDAERIVTVDGGAREKLAIELWIVPIGASPPQPSPGNNPSEARERERLKH